MSDSNDNSADPLTDLRSLVWVPDPMESMIDAQDHSLGMPRATSEIRLFWDDPPWDYIDPATADRWACAAAAERIAVAGLRREVALPATDSKWLDDPGLPRVLPYRNERFGIQADDFARVDFIDVRLDRYVSPDGRAVYRQEYLSRMGIETVSHDIASMTLPPEAKSVKDLSRTIDALRAFASESTRLLASVSAVTLAVDLPQLVPLGFDGFVLRADSNAFAGLPLARLVNQVRTQLDSAGFPETILWVVPPAISADDMAKLIALGADAIACDQWCDRLLWTPMETNAIQSSGVDLFRKMLRSEIGRQVDRVHGLVDQAIRRKTKPVLATTSQFVSDSLGLELIGGVRRSAT